MRVVFSLLLIWAVLLRPQNLFFEVATIKPTPPDDRSGRFAIMRGARQFVAKSYTLKYMVAAPTLYLSERSLAARIGRILIATTSLPSHQENHPRPISKWQCFGVFWRKDSN